MKIAAVTRTAEMVAGTETATERGTGTERKSPTESATGIVTGTQRQCERRSETGGIATKTVERDKRRPSNSQ